MLPWQRLWPGVTPILRIFKLQKKKTKKSARTFSHHVHEYLCAHLVYPYNNKAMKCITVSSLLVVIVFNAATLVLSSNEPSPEIHQVRGLSGGSARIELPCLVDQANCGEVYYITWTRQSQAPSNWSSSSSASSQAALALQQPPVAVQQQQQQSSAQWTRVYLYTGANDTSPHKPIGDLLNRATFIMPDKLATQSSPPLAEGESGNGSGEQAAPPMARLVIEEPKLSDEALYKCDVTYVKGKCPSISLVRLQMMALPGKAQIVALPGLASSLPLAQQQRSTPLADGQLIGPYNEHEQLRLACLVQGGRPAPSSVIWRKIDSSGRVINLMPARHYGQLGSALALGTSNKLMLHTQGDTQVEVHLNHTLTSSDLGAKFECHVEHEAMEQPAARIVSSGPVVVGGANEASGSKRRMEAAHDAMLDLHPARPSSGQEPPLPVTANLELADEQMSGRLPAKSLDSHVFVDLNVGVASLDLFMSKVNKRNSSEPLNEGDLVELECVAYNSRPPANITWFNGSESLGEQLESGGPGSGNLLPVPSAAPFSNLRQSQQPSTPTTAAEQKLRHKRLLQRNQVHLNSDGQTYTTHSFLSIKLSRHEHRTQIGCHAQNEPMRKPAIRSMELQVQHVPIVLMEPAGGIVVSENAATPEGAEQQQPGSENKWDNVIAGALGKSAPASAGGQQHFAGPHDWSAASSAGSGGSQDASEITIYCIYTANPSPLVANATRWFKDGQPLRDVVRAPGNRQAHLSESYTATGYPALTVRRPITRRDAGLYDCQVANVLGPSERLPPSEACRLAVNYRPTVQMRLFRPALTQQANNAERQSLTEVDLAQELVLPGSSFVLQCDVLEAQPSKIQKFHWFKVSDAAQQQQQQQAGQQQNQPYLRHQQQRPQLGLGSAGQEQQLIGVTESGQLALNSLAANFTPASFACSAFNALGASNQSNQIYLELSHGPGSSFVRPVNDATLRRMIVASGRPAHTAAASAIDTSDEGLPQPLAAGRELLLECVTPDLGQPSANIWLWFKNDQPIESSLSPSNGIDASHGTSSGSSNTNNNPSIVNNDANTPDDLILANDNPISGHDSSSYSGESGRQSRNRGPRMDELVPIAAHGHSKIKLINSGRYLFIPSIQLAHKGNYSCVAVNRFGSGQQPQPQSPSSMSPGRDSFQLRVALAPSFVQPLTPRTYWPEISSSGNNNNNNNLPTPAEASPQFELVCRVQCEPICHIEWLKNNERIDLRSDSMNLNNQYVSYQVKQTTLDENINANLFKSIESKLVFRFHDLSGLSSSSSSGPLLERDALLLRRHSLNGSNYTCQSSPNSIGPPVRSSTKFIVQYAPENVFINAPSDKLSLVEGSNGPRLSCEASGEPQVQYRWFLLKSSGGNIDSPFAASSSLPTTPLGKQYNQNRRASSAAGEGDGSSLEVASLGVGEQDQQQQAINQMASNAFQRLPSTKGANDPAGTELEDLIELTGSATSEQVGGTPPGSLISTLDLSSLSLDRRQSGHYVCEASNRLGQTRQSVYLNVLYKPTCATLHLHSLDLTFAPLLRDKQEGSNQIRTISRPFKATVNDEYSIVRETSEDFIDLRRMLVLSPLLSRGPQAQVSNQVSFKDSIFQTILNDKKSQENGSQQSEILGGVGGKFMQLKDKDALIHTDEKSDMSQQVNNLLVSDSGARQQSTTNFSDPLAKENFKHAGDSWDKFNMLLLKFLNTYMKQVKTYEEQLSEEVANKELNANRSQNRRSQSSKTEKSSRGINQPDEPDYLPMSADTKNFLTFACMVQDGNPMSNLTFDWLLGSTNLPVTGETVIDGDDINLTNSPDRVGKPILIYSNENYTLHIMLVRRLDTKSILNPFKMSLLTLNVILGPSKNSTNSTSRMRRDTSEDQANVARAPVIKKRRQSFYNNLKANNHNNNIQFAHEFEMKPYDSGPLTVALNEQNWQEQIGEMLRCTVSNPIGTSDLCHVRVNMAERLKSQSSSSESAKWRMPTLAHKSLLIISILIGCTVIVFVTMALLLGPHLKGFNPKRDDLGAACKEETNTGQSTSSQKSSVLGLIGNGDSSIQGSSDDDSSTRLNHNLENKVGAQIRMAGVREISMNHQGALSGYHEHEQNPSNRHHPNLSLREPGLDYDKPRDLQEQRMVYQCNSQFINDQSSIQENRGSNMNSSLGEYQYRTNLVRSKLPTNQVSENLEAPESRGTRGSAGSRILANLKFKSLSKFKVDRISDLSNFASRMDNIRSLHTKNISNSETNTTGLSSSMLDGELSMRMEQSLDSQIDSPSYLGISQLRHSHSSFKRAPPSEQQPMNRPEPSYYLYNNNVLPGETEPQMMMPLGAHRFNISTSNRNPNPAYSNLSANPVDVMEEFIRQREPIEGHSQTGGPSESAFYRSQSVRNQTSLQNSQAPMYLMKNDLNQYFPHHVNRGPPVYPRSHQASTMFRPHLDEPLRPPIATRSSLHQMPPVVVSDSPQQYLSRNNRYSMSAYNQPIGHPSSINEVAPLAPLHHDYMDTIDSHLNRLADTMASGQYPNQQSQQTAYANAMDLANSYAPQQLLNDHERANQSHTIEHIYDTNTYATPEHTPLRRPGTMGSTAPPVSSSSERPRVSQLIQTFNSNAPD